MNQIKLESQNNNGYTTNEKALPHVDLVNKESKLIKFSKDGVDETPLIESFKESLIDLSKAFTFDVPYGKCAHSETQECIDMKRIQMRKDDYFSSTINKGQLIEQCQLPEYFVISKEEVDRQYYVIAATLQVDSRKIEIIKRNLNLFELNNTKGPIGSLVSIDSLNCMINVNTPAIEKSFEEMKKEVIMTRFILNDGNSFYRSFMFGILEHAILYGNIHVLQKIAIGIQSKLPFNQIKRHNIEVNVSEILIILYLLITELESKNIKVAYELFITAANQSQSFDLGLIKYMRIALGEYIISNHDVIFRTEHWEEIKTIAAPAYLSNHSFDYFNYVNDRILAMDYGADKFIIQISPVVFRINLNLYAIEGTANEDKHIVFLKQYFHCLGDQSFHNSISVFYCFSRFHKLYSKAALKYHDTNITFRSMKTSYITKRFKVITEKAHCDTCSETSDIINFFHIPRTNFCRYCLKSTIDKLITRRLFHFTSEHYNNREYYFRYISLSERFEDKIEEEDFVALFGRSITQQIFYVEDRLCYKCAKLLEEEPHNMSCHCKFCTKCLIDNIMNSTNQLIILNNYEKSTLSIKPVNCPCGGRFDTNRAIEMVYQPKLVQLEREANERLAKTAEIVCAFCGKLHEKAKYSKTINMNTDTVKNQYIAVLKFNVLTKYENDIALHIMCKDCLKDLKTDKENKIRREEIKENATFYPLNCKVCLKTHQIEERTITESKSDSGCCFIY